MIDLWRRLEGWCAEHLPEHALKLRTPASPAAVAEAEAALGVQLPDDYRASLAVHDGQDDAPGVWLFAQVQQLKPLAAVVDTWRRERTFWDDADPEGRMGWLDKAGRVRQVHFHPRQIAIAGSTDFDHDRLLLDFVPAPGGVDGQVILRQDVYLEPITRTFRDLVEQTVAGLERATIVPGEPEGDAILLEYRAPRGKKRIAATKYFR